VAGFIADLLEGRGKVSVIERVRAQVRTLTAKFPVYRGISGI
jgi:hypothetical protein